MYHLFVDDEYDDSFHDVEEAMNAFKGVVVGGHDAYIEHCERILIFVGRIGIE